VQRGFLHREAAEPPTTAPQTALTCRVYRPRHSNVTSGNMA
jgi:hypothetical protein